MDSHPARKSAVFTALTVLLILLLIVLVLCAPAFAGPMSKLLGMM